MNTDESEINPVKHNLVEGINNPKNEGAHEAKQKDIRPISTKKCVGKESLQRMNYLYQVCNKLSTTNSATYKASIQYSNLMVNISKKAVQRLDMEVKRTICKGCRSLLLPGLTCKVRVKRNKVIKHCLVCARAKIFEVKDSEYVPWYQKNESLVDILDYTPCTQTNKS